jgi:hypothetical protein
MLMKELIFSVLAVAGVAGLRAGLKAYKAKGKFSGEVVAEALEGALDATKKP